MVLRSSLLLLLPVLVVFKYSKDILDPKQDYLMVIVVVMLIGFSIALMSGTHDRRGHYATSSVIRQRGCRRVCAAPCSCIARCATEQSFGLLLCSITLGILSFYTGRVYVKNNHLLPGWCILLSYGGAWLVNLLFYSGYHYNPWVRKAYFLFDFAIGTMLFLVLWVVSLFSFVGDMHAQLLFNSVVVRGIDRYRQQQSDRMFNGRDTSV